MRVVPFAFGFARGGVKGSMYIVTVLRATAAELSESAAAGSWSPRARNWLGLGKTWPATNKLNNAVANRIRVHACSFSMQMGFLAENADSFLRGSFHK